LEILRARKRSSEQINEVRIDQGTGVEQGPHSHWRCRGKRGGVGRMYLGTKRRGRWASLIEKISPARIGLLMAEAGCLGAGE